jgi:effector-binding domain-containing protein
MEIEMISIPLQLDIYGYSGVALDKNYAGTAFKLMDKMWQTVKSSQLPNKGKNIWVYEAAHGVFAGVELDNPPPNDISIEHKTLIIPHYVYFKHIGPYGLIRQTYQAMKEEVNRRGFQDVLPNIEIYGHWTNDETKLETELIMSLK